MINVTQFKQGYLITFNGEKKDFNQYMFLLSKIEYKKYSLKDKGWLVPTTDELKTVFSYQDPTEKPIIKIDDSAYADMGKNMKLQPYPYQKEAIKFCIDNLKALLVLPCGSGKTCLGIGAYLEAIERGIITGPGVVVVKASLKTQWKKEVEKFSHFSAEVIQTKSALCTNEYNRLKARERKLKKLDPLKQKTEYQSLKYEINEIEKEIEDKFNAQFEVDLLVLNYEALCNDDIRTKLHKIKPQFIFSDEIHYAKNYKAERSKALHEFGDAKVTIGATATPIQKDYQDAFGIFKFIKADLWATFSKFAGMYIKYAGPGRISGFKNTDNLRQKIAPHTFVKTKEEISSQLPSLMVMQRYCDLDDSVLEKTQQIFIELEELHDQERAIHARCKTEVEVLNNPELMQIEAKIMALQTFAQELADAPELLDNTTSEYAKGYTVKKCTNYKLELLANLVEEILESGEKVCIFSKFRTMQPIIAERLQKIDKNMKFSFVNGSVKDEARYDAVYTNFRDKDEYKVLLCSDAGAEGLNLSKCKYLIEYDLADSYAIQTQRHGRVERADSIHDNVFAYQLIANESWDEVAFKIVQKKESYDFELIKKIKEDI